MRSNWQLRRWLAREVLGQEIGRKPVKLKFTRGPARNWKYRAWVRTLPCAVCGRTKDTHTIEAAHTGPHAAKQKASDYTCIPLCVDHHRIAGDSLHQLSRAAFEQRHGFSIGALVRRLNCIWGNQWKIDA